ncbi:hypothetical protein LZQ00_04675 [Sphingobacterium sp. SRCM116780]|uniref:hypothetical protein n=1 Tax=Sphingobacterium sp. SRCM116780 TaxID=2907623 RepID=UPI001F280200|nr:hypothetical protein [Sphingobacterium sp. SRCM116780]UIR57110.1 hypothetical protein LZQ00_04675 [Sphingobacterium sp. SRCM116780]
MKKKRTRLTILVVVLLPVLYYILSVLLMGNGRFVNYYFPSQFSIENSKNNNNFIKVISPDRIEIVDSIWFKKVNDKLQIYTCDSFYFKSYGIFNLFKHKINRAGFVCLNVNSLNEERLMIQYGNGEIYSIGDSNSYRNLYKIGSSVSLKIFTKDKELISILNFIKL